MKQLRIILWGAVAVFAGVFAYLNLFKPEPDLVGRTTVAEETIRLGGPFNLVDNTGAAVSDNNLEGRNHALFFGFTHCPDICPATLVDAASWLHKLGPKAADVDFYFITVDPERDTVEILNDYVTAFDSRITGLTGESAEIESMLKSYKIYAERVDLGDGDYTMDHSAQVLLFRADGSLQGTIAFNEAEQTALEKLERLAKNS